MICKCFVKKNNSLLFASTNWFQICLFNRYATSNIGSKYRNRYTSDQKRMPEICS